MDFKLVALTGTFAAASLINFSTSLPSQDTSVKQLKFVGNVEGKSYFMEDDQPMSWLEASAFCKNLNMDLASIESVAQSALIGRYLHDNDYHRTTKFWTSARETRSHAGFTWNSTDGRPNIDYLEEWIGLPVEEIPYEFCGVLHEFGDGSRITMETVRCQDRMPGTLCQG